MQNDMPGRRIRLVIEVLLAGLILALGVQVGSGTLALRAEMNREKICMQNLKIIGREIARDVRKDSRPPDDLGPLFSSGLYGNALICPSDTSGKPQNMLGGIPPYRCSYLYLGNADSKSAIVVMCRHHRTKRNPYRAIVLRLNGTVEITDIKTNKAINY